VSALDIAVYVAVGLIGSFCSGLLGVGGAIVTYPLLYFLPPLIGAYAMTPNEIAATTMLQVFTATGVGMLMYCRSPWFSRRVVLFVGGGMLLGSLVGSLASSQLPGLVIHWLYGLMALVAVVLMLRKEQGVLPSAEDRPLDLHRGGAILAGSSVGVLSGIVGAGGSFLLIPILIRLLRVPIRTAIASSLTVVFVSSIGGAVGKIVGGQLHWGLTICVVSTSLFGSFAGAKLGQRLDVALLRFVLALIILGAALNIWGEIFWQLLFA